MVARPSRGDVVALQNSPFAKGKKSVSEFLVVGLGVLVTVIILMTVLFIGSSSYTPIQPSYETTIINVHCPADYATAVAVPDEAWQDYKEGKITQGELLKQGNQSESYAKNC